MLPILVLGLLWLTNGAGEAKPATTSKVWPVPPALPLALTEVKTTSTQWFFWMGAPQCDGDANIYWHTYQQTGNPNLQELTFVKLLTDGSSVTYHPVGSQSAELDFISYYVSHDGELFVLATERANYKTLYLLKAANDPGSFSSTKLDLPDGLDPVTVNGFAVLPSGESFLHGYFGKEAAKADRGRSYFLELDASGRLLRRSSGQVSDSVAKDVEKNYLPLPVSPAIGDDGLIYVLRPGRVLALSPNGEVARTISLSPPKDGYDSPSELRVAGSRLLLTWFKRGAPHQLVETEYELVDGSTGEVLRLYHPTDNKEMLVCFTGNSLILDGGSKAGSNIKLVTAPVN
jgi:outer membrane protein assembly factor BamB